MLRALYDYKTDTKQYLSFQTGDQFTVLDSSNKDWFLAQNGFGEIGYVAKNYVVKDEVTEIEVMKSIDRAIEIIHLEASRNGGQYTHTQRENLTKLVQHRKNVIQTYEAASSATIVNNATEESGRRSIRRSAPPPPLDSSTKSMNGLTVESVNSQLSQPFMGSQMEEPCVESRKAPASNVINLHDCLNISSVADNLDVPSCRIGSSDNYREPSGSINSACSPIHSRSNSMFLVDLDNVPVPSGIGSDLVQKVRQTTGLSYKKSCVAVEAVLDYIGLHIPEMSHFVHRLYATLDQPKENDVEDSNSDFTRVCELFTQLMAHKDDSQQRGWALHEDEEIIANNLEELLSILENAKQSVARKALSHDGYEGMLNLVQYYQMENRVKLRLLLLRVFGAMCALDNVAISQLLFSVLTTELATELQININDVQRSSYVCLLLSMLFSTGEAAPANLQDFMDAKFMNFVFDTIESGEHDEQLTNLLVQFVLAFNLHFLRKDNLVMHVLAERRTAKVFTEKILLLFNRDEDPVQMLDHDPKPPNSIMKLLQDMYNDPGTATILYTNDAKVLIDIVLQHIVDLPAGDKLRSAHLKLLQLYFQTSDYVEHRHRYTELKECLRRIEREEEQTGDDKHIVKHIFSELNIFME